MTTGLNDSVGYRRTTMAKDKEQRSFTLTSTSILKELHLGFSMKVEQEEALKSKKDVFAVLPTGATGG